MMVVCMLMDGRRVPYSCSSCLGHLELVVVDLGLAVVSPGQAGGGISFLLRVWLLLEGANSAVHVSSAQAILQVILGSYLRL